MKSFWRSHYEKILVAVAAFFLIVLTSLYIWGARFLLSSFSRTTDIPIDYGGIVHFNVTGAAQIGGIR